MLQVEVTIKSDCECRRESTTNCTNPNCETIPLCTYENRISDEMVCAGAKGKGGTKVYVFFLASRAALCLYCRFINSPLIIQSDRRSNARTSDQITSNFLTQASRRFYEIRQPLTSSYSFQLPHGCHGHHGRHGYHGRHSHGGHVGHGGLGKHGGHGGPDRTGQEKTE